MKTIIFLCLFVTLCAAQFPPPNILDQLAQGVKNAKSRVDTITSDARRNRQTLKMNTENEISNLYYDSSRIISQVQSTRIQDIQKQLEEAKANGKDASACLNAVANKMNAAAQTGNRQLSLCQNKGKQLLENELKAYDVAMATGDKLKIQLDGIFLQCYSSNLNQMTNCIALKLGSTNAEVRNYEDTVNALNRNSSRIKSQILLSVRECNSAAVSDVRSASTDAIYAAAACLKD